MVCTFYLICPRCLVDMLSFPAGQDRVDGDSRVHSRGVLGTGHPDALPPRSRGIPRYLRKRLLQVSGLVGMGTFLCSFLVGRDK